MKKVFFTISLLMLGMIINAQSMQNYVVSSSGESATSTNLIVDYTIGEPVVELQTSSSMELSQGFHQPSLTVTAIENIELEDIKCYPNPVSDNLTVDIPLTYHNAFVYTIYDMSGRTLISRTVYAGTNTIDMNSYSIGNYILILTESGTNNVFKSQIVKIK